MAVAEQRASWAWTPQTIHRPSDDEFFKEGDALCVQHRKQFVVMMPDEEEAENIRDSAFFKCQSTGCGCVFNSIQQYESHYNSEHRYPCMECKQSFPNSHLLDVHITEWHNPMFEELSRTQSMYQCLLDTCPETFKDYQERKDHMIKIHKFPANYRFEKPPKHKRQPKKQRNEGAEQMDVEVMDGCDVEVSSEANSNLISQEVGQNVKSLSSLAYKCLPGQTNKPKASHQQAIKERDPTEIGMPGNGSEMRMDAEDPSTMKSCMNASTSGPRRFQYNMAAVPQNICFGAGSQRGFHGRGRHGKKGRGRHWYQAKTKNQNTTCNIEEVDMDDMSAALDT